MLMMDTALQVDVGQGLEHGGAARLREATGLGTA